MFFTNIWFLFTIYYNIYAYNIILIIILSFFLILCCESGLWILILKLLRFTMYLHAITLFIYLPYESNNIPLKSVDMNSARYMVMKTVQRHTAHIYLFVHRLKCSRLMVINPTMVVYIYRYDYRSSTNRYVIGMVFCFSLPVAIVSTAVSVWSRRRRFLQNRSCLAGHVSVKCVILSSIFVVATFVNLRQTIFRTVSLVCHKQTIPQVLHSKSLRSRSRCLPICACDVQTSGDRGTRLFESLKDSRHLSGLWCGIQLEGHNDFLHVFKPESIGYQPFYRRVGDPGLYI